MNLEEERERLREVTELHEKCGDVGAVFSRLLEPQTKLVTALEQLEQAREALFSLMEDLRLRAQKDHDDTMVVDVSWSIWEKARKAEQALKQQEVGDE
ncbi:hypothetical protein [Zhongshania sp.]|uniref:hypothetical protein n=1 Tax=Zhongshania sp. TaxID=1971902 RepID=UPI003567E6BA